MREAGFDLCVKHTSDLCVKPGPLCEFPFIFERFTVNRRPCGTVETAGRNRLRQEKGGASRRDPTKAPRRDPETRQNPARSLTEPARHPMNA